MLDDHAPIPSPYTPYPYKLELYSSAQDCLSARKRISYSSYSTAYSSELLDSRPPPPSYRSLSTESLLSTGMVSDTSFIMPLPLPRLPTASNPPPLIKVTSPTATMTSSSPALNRVTALPYTSRVTAPTASRVTAPAASDSTTPSASSEVTSPAVSRVTAPAASRVTATSTAAERARAAFRVTTPASQRVTAPAAAVALRHHRRSKTTAAGEQTIVARPLRRYMSQSMGDVNPHHVAERFPLTKPVSATYIKSQLAGN